MRFEQRGHVGCHHCDGIAACDAAPRQRRRQPAAARVELRVGGVLRAVDHRDLAREDRGRAREEIERRQGCIVGWIAVEVPVVHSAGLAAGLTAPLGTTGGRLCHAFLPAISGRTIGQGSAATVNR
jgi:hypothetical protein